MDRRVLLRPEVKVKKKTAKEKVLSADLAAAYACYHSNLVEQRKLVQKLEIIDIETKQMKRNIRQQREVLEKEMKKTESDYWNCHRVFSAETLITESDSYRKRCYMGPQPTKAKLPRRTLERLSQLVRSLQAVDDLETLSRFQRCTRYARRRTHADIHDHESVSSLTLSQDGSGVFDPWEQQHLAEMPDARSTDKSSRLSSNTSIKENRIRSAPVRVESRTGTLGESKKRHPSAGPRQHAPKKLEVDISQNSAAFFETSKGMTQSGGKEKALVRFAWTEQEKTDTTVDNTIDTCLSDVTVKDPSLGIDLIQASPEHDTSHSSGHQPCDVNLALTSTQCRILQGSSDKVSSHQDPQRNESSFVHNVQSKEAKISEPDHRDSKCSATCQDQAYIQGPIVENQRGRDENLKNDSISDKDVITPNNGWNLIRIAYFDNKLSMPNSCDILKNEDFARISEERGKMRDVILPESEGECTLRKQASSHRIDEAQHLRRRKSGDRDAEVTRKNAHGAALYNNEGAETTSGRKISVALPKSSLHGLSSCRKLLTPRTQHKPLQTNHRAPIKAEDKQELRNNFVNLHANMLPHDVDKRPEKEKQAKDAPKKRKLSIFKRACLSDALFSAQTKVESQLRNRVQGFMGAIHTVDETIEKSTGEEELQ